MANERLHVMVQRAVQKYVAAQQAKPLDYLHLEPKPPATWPMPRPAHRPAPMKPETAALIGGLADAASTYTMLKRGWGVEGNPLPSALDHG